MHSLWGYMLIFEDIPQFQNHMEHHTDSDHNLCTQHRMFHAYIL